MARLFYYTYDTIKRFKRLMWEHYISISLGALFILVFLVARISIAECLRYNSNDLYMLGCEMVTESGPTFDQAAKAHKNILEDYKNNMNRRYLSNFLIKLLYSQYNPNTTIDKAIKSLERSKNLGQEDPNIIWNAGEILIRSRNDMISLLRRGRIDIGFSKYAGSSITDIDKAIEDSSKAWDTFIRNLENLDKNKSLENAWNLCEKNRRTLLVLFDSRADCSNIKYQIENFKCILKKSIEGKKKLADEFPPDSPQEKLVNFFVDSDQRRLNILEAMSEGNVGRICYIIARAVEEAKQDQFIKLEIAKKLNYSFIF